MSAPLPKYWGEGERDKVHRSRLSNSETRFLSQFFVSGPSVLVNCMSPVYLVE